MHPNINETDIRVARVQDAYQIYDLLVEAFGGRYLPYTVFQSPLSVIYLQRLIRQGVEQSSHIFHVTERFSGVKGFYNAVVRQRDFFLNYIAVCKSERSVGVGQALLNHFEAHGTFLGCRQYVLDVFESNQTAYRWYLKHGYFLDSMNFQVRLSTAQGATKKNRPMRLTKEDLQTAMKEEQAQGFSKVDGRYEAGQITVGLIAGRACKLLTYQNIELVEAVEAVCARFQSDRTELIIPALPVLPTNWSILDSEKTLRLIKPVTS